MSTPTDPKDELNDDDMRALFNSDKSTTPPALDQAILSAARKAVTSQHEPHTATSNETKRWYAYWPQGLSAAAVVVLAVVLVPMIGSTPESSLESENSVGADANITAAAPASVDAESTISLNRRAVAQRKSGIQNGSVSASVAADSMESSASASEATSDATSGLSIANGSMQFFNSQKDLVAFLDGSSYTNEANSAWRLMFDGNTFTWIQPNQEHRGNYILVGENIFTAQLPDRELTIELTEQGLVWDGLVYHTD